MKRQTGVWIDAQVWDAYRELCNREKVRLSEPIEEYLRLVLQNGSALTILNMMQSMARARSGGFEDYARVLLNWHRTGQFWIQVTDENEVSVSHMLLHALKEVADPQLREEIREALMVEPRKQAEKTDRRKKTTKKLPDKRESPSRPAQARTVSERIGDMKRQIAGREMDAAQAQKMLNKIHQIREKLKSDDKGRHRKGSPKAQG
ncbi:MAG TPA: hypothetical protein VMT42_04350 [candidate division Zixibacteria bacterium]|nr:hypothetical protein [candidate division Zixibacteria bacterium]